MKREVREVNIRNKYICSCVEKENKRTVSQNTMKLASIRDKIGKLFD